MKIVVNVSYGGFSLSKSAKEYLYDNYSIEFPYEFSCPLERNDHRLVECVEVLGGIEAGGSFAKLGIIEIPDDIEWEINEYDGYEYVVEKHRSWHYKGK